MTDPADTSPQVTRVDETTLRLIRAVGYAGVAWGEFDEEENPLMDRTLELMLDDAENALAQRILELQEIARGEGHEAGHYLARHSL